MREWMSEWVDTVTIPLAPCPVYEEQLVVLEETVA